MRTGTRGGSSLTTVSTANSQLPTANCQGTLFAAPWELEVGDWDCRLPVHLGAQLDLPRRVAHRGDAGEVPGVLEIQRPREVERWRIRQVEGLGADLELPLAGDPELLGEAEVDPTQRRTGDLAAAAAERTEVGLPDR